MSEDYDCNKYLLIRFSFLGKFKLLSFCSPFFLFIRYIIITGQIEKSGCFQRVGPEVSDSEGSRVLRTVKQVVGCVSSRAVGAGVINRIVNSCSVAVKKATIAGT